MVSVAKGGTWPMVTMTTNTNAPPRQTVTCLRSESLMLWDLTRAREKERVLLLLCLPDERVWEKKRMRERFNLHGFLEPGHLGLNLPALLTD